METFDIEEGGKVHSMVGPSSFHRTLNCAGSNNLVRKLGDKARRSGIAAKEGSAAHDLLARCLQNNEEAWEHAGEKITFEGMTFEVTSEMQDAVQMALDWTRSKLAIHADKGAYLLVEQRVSSPEDAEAFGTSDIIIVVPRERLIVGDFKYGIGVVVEPDDEQLRGYGQYTFETFVQLKDLPGYAVSDAAVGDELVFPDHNTVCELYIIQPRIPHPKGFVRRHVTNKDELARWFYGEVLPGIKETRDPNAPLVIGDWCGFCPAADHCPLLRKTTMEMNTEIDPATRTDEDLDALAVKIQQIEKLGKRVDLELFARAMKGSKFEHWKLVRKIASRVWKDGAEAEIKAAFGEKAYSKPELLGVPAIEKMEGGKALVSRWSMKPETGATLAARSDKRDEFVSAMDALDKVEGNTTEEVVW
jgi:hypothetical protein